MKPAEGDIIADRFQLIRELGSGGMGCVWLADHLTLEVRCAVKFIAVDVVRNPAYLAQFHVEARTIAQVQSPHVVRVLDHDVCGDLPYIAMELLEGEDLRTRLRREGRLGLLETHRIVSQIARGLSKAHAAGIIHRDLKPENVFLVAEDGEVVVKLFDFGVAQWTASLRAPSSGTAEGLVGTPEYMSPEQTRGTDAIDHRADLWALAVIAFECLTGRLPFAAGTMSELFEQITAGTLPVPSEIAADLPARVDGWWLRAASRTIDERFQSARELVHEFGSALGVADSGSSTSLVPFERTLPKGSLPGRRDGPSSGRLLQIGYAVAAVALVAALLLPFAQRAYGHRARSEVAAFAAPRAEEATYGAPRTTLARIEVLAMPPGSTRSIQRSTWPRLLPARAPHQGRPAGARPSPRDDPDGVLGI